MRGPRPGSSAGGGRKGRLHECHLQDCHPVLTESPTSQADLPAPPALPLTREGIFGPEGTQLLKHRTCLTFSGVAWARQPVPAGPTRSLQPERCWNRTQFEIWCSNCILCLIVMVICLSPFFCRKHFCHIHVAIRLALGNFTVKDQITGRWFRFCSDKVLAVFICVY